METCNHSPLLMVMGTKGRWKGKGFVAARIARELIKLEARMSWGMG